MTHPFAFDWVNLRKRGTTVNNPRDSRFGHRKPIVGHDEVINPTETETCLYLSPTPQNRYGIIIENQDPLATIRFRVVVAFPVVPILHH